MWCFSRIGNPKPLVSPIALEITNSSTMSLLPKRKPTPSLLWVEIEYLSKSGWWFQPLRKILVNGKDDIPYIMENNPNV
jgi:hypothetical protein